jgi:hypothetical protein
MKMTRASRLVSAFVLVGWSMVGCSARDDTSTGGRGGSGGTTGGQGGGGQGGDGTGATGGTGGSTGGSGGSSGSAGTAGTGGSGGSGGIDGGSGTASCLEVQACRNQCANSSCRDACLATGTPQAQMLTIDLLNCIDQNCPAGSPRTCRTDVQCLQDGPCRTLNETCVGQSPDPDCP